MSQQNVETVHRFTEAFNCRDLDSLRATVHPEATFPTLAEGQLHGHEGSAQWAANWWEGDFVAYVEIGQLIDAADAVIAAIVLETRSIVSGQTAERHHVAVELEFRDGKVSKWTPHPSRARALEAVGLRD